MPLAPADLATLAEARRALESPGLAMRLSALVGSPIEKGMERLPAGWRNKLGGVAQDALGHAIGAAARTLDKTPRAASPRLHKLLGSISGGAGGAFGLAGLTVEIPVSTVLIMRAILDIARAHGEDIDTAATRMAALEVFALGGPGKTDDAVDTGYYAVRAALANAVSDAARHLAGQGVAGLGQQGAPAITRLLAMVAARYKVQLTQKAAGMLVPGIGAVAGASVNLLFMNHFQSVSDAHFSIRRLERHYGEETVHKAYLNLAPST